MQAVGLVNHNELCVRSGEPTGTRMIEDRSAREKLDLLP